MPIKTAITPTIAKIFDKTSGAFFKIMPYMHQLIIAIADTIKPLADKSPAE